MNNKEKSIKTERLEKQKLARRKRYAEIKEDPLLYEREKEKEKKRYQRRKEKKQIKSVYEESTQAQREKRQKWREAAKKYRRKKKCIKNSGNLIKSEIKNDIETGSDDDLIIVTDAPEPIKNLRDKNKITQMNNGHESPTSPIKRNKFDLDLEDTLIVPDSPNIPVTITNTKHNYMAPLISTKTEKNNPIVERKVTGSSLKDSDLKPSETDLDFNLRIKRIRNIERKRRQKLLLSIGKLQFENMQLKQKIIQQQRALKTIKTKTEKDTEVTVKEVSNDNNLNNKEETRLRSPKSTGGIDWELEKIIWDFVMAERRKNYSRKDFLMLDHIDPWSDYVKKNMKNNFEDLKEFNKIKLNNKLNKELSTKVSIFNGDITRLEVHALVNSTNAALEGPTGYSVDAAIHRAAGPLLQEELDTFNGCERGEAKITSGHLLPAEYIIHTVGPEDGTQSILEMCYRNCLAYHKTHGIKSMAFPCIATGTFDFPKRPAAHIALRTVRQFLEQNESMDRIIFCVYEQEDKEIYEKLLQMYFPVQELN